MKPTLLFYPHISSYSALLLLAFICGWVWARARAPLYQIQKRHVDNLALLLCFAGLFGARFFARLFYAKLPLLEALQVWKGDGLVFYGGFLFGIASVLLYARFCQIQFFRMVDCLAPSLALGLAIGRVGCFLAGCCWGDLCASPHHLAALSSTPVYHQVYSVPAISTPRMPFAVQFPAKTEPFKQHLKLDLLPPSASRSLPVHPVQLYEAALAFLLAGFLHARTRTAKPGDLALWLLAGYALIRFATEYLRADNKPHAFGLTISQVISCYLLLGSVALGWLKAQVLKPASLNPHRTNPADPVIAAR